MPSVVSVERRIAYHTLLRVGPNGAPSPRRMEELGHAELALLYGVDSGQTQFRDVERSDEPARWVPLMDMGAARCGALREAYGLAGCAVGQRRPALRYRAWLAGEVEFLAPHSTDGLLGRYPPTGLAEDRRIFPPYDAAAVVRGGLAREQPAAVAALGATVIDRAAVINMADK